MGPDPKEWVPQLEGRVIAVSESDPFTPQTMPTLPLAVVGVLTETYEQFPTILTDFMLEVMLAPRRYEKDGGGETPFWAYYDYTVIRDHVIEGIEGMGGVRLLQMEIEADPMAVYLNFRLRRQSRWCPPAPQASCGPDLESGGAIITARAIPARFFGNRRPTENKEGGDVC